MTTGLNDPKISKNDTPVDGSGILAQFQDQVTDFVNNSSKWATDGTDPFLNNFPLGGYSISGTNFGGVDPLAAGQTITTAPDPGSLPGARVVAADVESALRSACATLSRARNIHLRKYYYDAGFVLQLWADFGVVLANLTSAWKVAGDFSAGLTTNTAVDASSLDAYVATLSGELAGFQATTAFYEEYWCHAACHASHSSRNRR